MWWWQVVLEPRIKQSFSFRGGILFCSRALSVVSLNESESSYSLFECITYLHKVHHLPFHVPFSFENCTSHLFVKINSRSRALSVFVGMFTGIGARWRSLRSCMMVSTFISIRNLTYWCFGCLLRLIIVTLCNLAPGINLIDFFNAGWLSSVFCSGFAFLFACFDLCWRFVILWRINSIFLPMFTDRCICLTCTRSPLPFWGLSIWLFRWRPFRGSGIMPRARGHGWRAGDVFQVCVLIPQTMWR